MCGYDLRGQAQRGRRLSWIDVILVAAVLGVLIFWWRVGTESVRKADQTDVVQAILPTSIPLMQATVTPTPTVTPPPTPTAIPITQETVLLRHVVGAGETLLSLAIQYDVSVEEIQRANNLSSELIRVDDELMIPVLRDSAVAQLRATTTEFQYLVTSGDTLSTIATKFGSTVESLLAANKLTAGQFIRPGDLLVVPVSGAPLEALQVATEGLPGQTTSEPAAYAQLRLLEPQQGAIIARTDPVVFEWGGIDQLAENEWYVLQILPRNLAARTLPTTWTKQPTHRLEPSVAPMEGAAADYAWLVSVVRVKRDADGRALLEAASPISSVRTFSWR